ncbi:uncharacterized protein LOC141656696 [Silene latifolia]|uniref:uncharacterized protein LOC141656696 n=1 Tax=Silene latifolia TaxID=37657 RepID=UPI003D77030E
MECNKDEAIRAKEIAVRKFTDKDYLGAKKFALKAQALYPGLEGISQMLITLDVYISAENKVHGETDLYGLLGVQPLADDETIKKQYRKLVLQLHPDKNKSIGAEGAFQFVTEAFNCLSDKVKRSAYNTKRLLQMAPKVPSYSSVPIGASGSKPTSGRTVDQKASAGLNVPLPSVVNGSHKRAGSASGKSQKGATQKKSSHVQSFFKKGDTFWTVCARCRMQYEYMRIYLGQMLKCPGCEQGFLASEVPPPSNVTPIRPDKQSRGSHSNSKPRFPKGSKISGDASARWSPLSGTTAFISKSTSASQPTKGSLKREREEAHANSDFVSKGEGPAKKIRKTNGSLSQNGIGNMDIGLGNGYGSNAFQGNNVKANVNKELSAVDAKKMVSEKALVDMREKVRNWKLDGEKAKVKQSERKKSNPGSHKNNNNNSDSHIGSKLKTISEAPEFSVPDPDFHVFDNDRLENCFKENQVWAAYDNDDGMPRFYALIQEVTSVGGFKMRISWLNSRSNTEFGALDWVGRGFRKTCGDFWVGKHEDNDRINSFSHKVKWDKGPRGVIQIYPREGEIWALYRNWSPDWNLNTSIEVRHAYEMVEVVQDYKEEEGVYVAPITKAPGFRTVYCEQPDPKVLTHIPKEEMFRFSHQVPHHILTGSEKPNAPKGFVELDPAATPAHLLHMTMTTIDEQPQVHHEMGKAQLSRPSIDLIEVDEVKPVA